MLQQFRLEQPQNVSEASELLARFGDSAKIYAGGTELLLAMKEGLVSYERLIDIKGIKGLSDVNHIGECVHIGALCTHHQLEASPVLTQQLPVLTQLESKVANVRVRQAGTIGGNLCFSEPHADPGTLLIALDAHLIAEKSNERRQIPVETFFVDAYETTLEPDEVLTQIVVPIPAKQSGTCYMKFGYLERPSVGVAVALTLSEDKKYLNDIRIAVGCAGPSPKRIVEAEPLLKARSVDEAVGNLSQAGRKAAQAAQAISDLHGAQDYKEHIVQVLLNRTFRSALKQCGTDQ